MSFSKGISPVISQVISPGTSAATVAILGRPNVGKSSLFNRLTGKNHAIVYEQAGVTRDWREAFVSRGERSFRLLDTPGWVMKPDSEVAALMCARTLEGLAASDAIVLVLDRKNAFFFENRALAALIRRAHKPTCLVVNKCESDGEKLTLEEAWRLGLGQAYPISAREGEGLDSIEAFLTSLPQQRTYASREPPQGAVEAKGIRRRRPESTASTASTLPPEIPDDQVPAERLSGEEPLKLAIIGRPNVGKSSFVNRLSGYERMLTGPMAGLTRDALQTSFVWSGRPVRLVDTAGLRKKALVREVLEKKAAAEALHAVRFADCVALLFDAQEGLTGQDLALARFVQEHGRILVVVAHKWDLIRKDRASQSQQKRIYQDAVARALPLLGGVSFFYLSSLRDRDFDSFFQSCFTLKARWSERISTNRLNRWLAQCLKRHPPPLIGSFSGASSGHGSRGPRTGPRPGNRPGIRSKIRYITQHSTRPPSFLLWTSRPAAVPVSYQRFLAKSLREEFALAGLPVRFTFRRTPNPYTDTEDAKDTLKRDTLKRQEQKKREKQGKREKNENNS